jgi:hypothetical protein
VLFPTLWEEESRLVTIQAMACRVPVTAHNSSMRVVKSIELQRNYVGKLDRRATT